MDNTKSRFCKRFTENIYGKQGERNPHYRELPVETEREIAHFKDQDRVCFNSYGYLGLNMHEDIQMAAVRALGKYGTSTGGVRCLSGSRELHRQLEGRLARIFGKEDAIVYSSGYLANYSALSSLMSKGDTIIADQFAHRSLQDGCAYSGAEVRHFQHNNMYSLKEQLKTAQGNKLIVVDGVYSMHGDIANIPEISHIARESGALLYVDEAHSFGTLGKSGKGVIEHFNLDKRDIDINMGTLSKTIPSTGGYVCASKDIVEQLVHISPGAIFSAALTPQDAGASLASLEVMEKETWRVMQLRRNIDTMRNLCNENHLDIGTAGYTPIFPIFIRNNEQAGQITDKLWDAGYWVNYVGYPAVPRGSELLRICLTTDHQTLQIEGLAKEITKLKRNVRL